MTAPGWQAIVKAPADSRWPGRGRQRVGLARRVTQAGLVNERRSGGVPEAVKVQPLEPSLPRSSAFDVHVDCSLSPPSVCDTKQHGPRSWNDVQNLEFSAPELHATNARSLSRTSTRLTARIGRAPVTLPDAVLRASALPSAPTTCSLPCRSAPTRLRSPMASACCRHRGYRELTGSAFRRHGIFCWQCRLRKSPTTCRVPGWPNLRDRFTAPWSG